MSRYYLIHESIEPIRLDRWYMLERGVDFKRIPPKESMSKSGHITTKHDVIYEADTLPDMLHQMHQAKDWRFYVVDDSYNSLGESSREKYPHHRHVCSLAGFIPEVCDIRSARPFMGEKWRVEYQKELWVCHGGWGGDCLYKVEGFTEKMERAVREYMAEHGLTMGTTEDE